MTLTEIAIKRPSLIIVIFSVLILGGIISYNKIGYELMPDFAQPIATIQVVYPGASPAEVESKVTREIEDAVSGLDNIDEINSKSYEGLSLVSIFLNAGTDVDLSLQEAQRKVDNILANLPEDAKAPVFSKISQSDLPIIQLTATSTLPDKKFYTLLDNQIKPRLQKIKGVAEITLLGGQEREIRVSADPNKLQYYGVSLLELNAAVASGNVELPTGKVKDSGTQTTLRLAGRYEDVEALRNQVVRSVGPNGSPIRVRDLASVTDDVKEASSISRYNGRTGIGILIKKQPDGNAVGISEAVKQELTRIEQSYESAGVQLVIASDTADFTLESVHAVQHDLVIAIILVAAVMLLFLHSLRNAFIVLLSIPTSLVSTLIAMALFGYSFNLMTLLAMSLVIGILVDDSIVVLENIQRHLEMGKSKRQAALDGRNEIGFSALSITLVDVVVFLPIVLFVNTTIGDILRQFSVVVVVSTLMSLFVCFTLTPWLASRLGKLEHLNPKNPFDRFLLWFEKGLHHLTEWYVGRLRWTLNHKLLSTAIVLACFGGLFYVMSLGILGDELVARGDQGKFTLKLEYDKNTSLEGNSLRTRQVEEFLLSKPEVISVFANIGGPSTASGGAGQGSPNVSELSVELVEAKDRNQRTEEYMLSLRKELLRQMPGVNIGSSVVGIGAGGAPIELVLTGPDYNQLIETGKRVKSVIEQVPGAIDTKVSVEDGMPELNVNIDRKRLASLGLDMSTVGATLRTAYTGNDDAKYREKGNEYDIRVMLDEFDRRDPDDVKELTFINNKGEKIELSQFATITQSTGPSQLERQDRQPSLTITANILGTTTGKVSAGIDKALAQSKVLPKEVSLTWGGDTKRSEESMGALFAALAIGLACVYLIMVALYDNFVYPLVVIFSIPVALIGAFLALNIAKSSMSVFAMLGIIMLLGLVAKNAILLVDFANAKKAEGADTFTALLEAGRTRLRPIIMTTLAMVIGMLPIALAKGAGSEWKNGLALVLMGGLLSSMMLTVFVVPMAYYTVDLLGDKWKQWTSGRKTSVAPEVEITR